MKFGYTLAAAGLLVLGACDSSSTAPGTTGGNVAIKFGTGSATSANLLADVKASGTQNSLNNLTLTGTNGTLVIQDIRLVASKFKLKSTEESVCRDSANASKREQDSDCDEFVGGPFIVDLPLDSTNTTVATDNVPPGTYSSFSFMVKALNGDAEEDDDSSEVRNAPAVLAQIRTTYPNFPSNASMVVKGTFNGTPFTDYFRVVTRISQKLDPPLVVPGDKSVEVTIDPSLWFKTGSTVMNLAALNGQTIQMGSGFINGVRGSKKRNNG